MDDILSDIQAGSIKRNALEKLPTETYDVKALMVGISSLGHCVSIGGGGGGYYNMLLIYCFSIQLSQIKAPQTYTPQLETYQSTPKSKDVTFTLSMPQGQRRIFPDRVDMVLGQRFRRERQGRTASFLGSGKVGEGHQITFFFNLICLVVRPCDVGVE